MTPSIIHTKLYRPTEAVDLVRRTRLHERLNQGLGRPLTLVSGPAGYGKSMLVSDWLAAREEPFGWLSLDDEDDDLSVFLNCLMAALRTAIPEACPATHAMLEAPDLPPLSVLAPHLINELGAIETRFVLVLDDLQRIHEPAVHELLDLLLKHPPRPLHLVLVTRRDPPLRLAALRAKDQVTEVQIQDLAFTATETAAFLGQAVGLSVSEDALANLQREVEGWAAGLRLVCLALKHQDDPDRFLCALSGGIGNVREYLVGEVLAGLGPAVRSWLIKTSILDRFCARLCQALDLQNGDLGSSDLRGETFIQTLEQGGLFAIALDPAHEWFRYQQQFQQVLREELHRTHDHDEIAALHHRGSTWFEREGLIDEAIRHALAGGDATHAGRLVREHGHEVMEDESVTRMERWLNLLPGDTVERDPMLLLYRAFIHRFRNEMPEMASILDEVERRLPDEPPSESRLVEGYLSAMRAFERYVAQDSEQAAAAAQRALELIPPEHRHERWYAMNLYAGTLQMTGRYPDARGAIHAALADPSFRHDTCQDQLTTGLCSLAWLEADLDELRLGATRLLELAAKTDSPQCRLRGQTFMGMMHYQRNELREAVPLLAQVVESHHVHHHGYFATTAAGLVLTRLALGQPREARAVADLVRGRALETGSRYLLGVGSALQAEVALRQGQLAAAMAWAREASPGTSRSLHFYYLPDLALARALITEGAPESRQRAGGVLSRIETIARDTHNRSVLIPVLALQALLLDSRGDAPAALEKLAESVSAAAPGRCLRFFLDLEAPMAALLERLAEKRIGGEFVTAILAAGKGEAAPPPAGADLAAPLTTREEEILEFLAQRLRDKEIASALHISPETVKSHLKNVYQKLHAGNRRHAVSRARELGILRDH